MPTLPKRRPHSRSLTQKELWALYGLNRPPSPRYSDLKGILWWVTSVYVRKRDFQLYHGACIGCDRIMDSWKDLQAGHFISASKCGFALLFDLRNINGECGACNKWDKQKLTYERNLDLRYGKGTAQEVKEQYFESRKVGKTGKEFSHQEYDRRIKHLLGEIERFDF